MEPKPLILILLLISFISSCSAPKYVPKLEEVPFSAYGSHIEIKQLSGAEIEGELIAVDSKTLFVLTAADSIKKLHNLPVSDIEKFKLTYAQPKSYAWTIPVYTLSTLSHGYFALFTAPVNAVVTSVVTARGANAFTYNEQVMSYEELSKFARFPQGIPPKIDTASIR